MRPTVLAAGITLRMCIDARAPMRGASQVSLTEKKQMRRTTMAMTLGLALSLGAVGVASAQSTQQPQRVEYQGRWTRRGPGEGLLKGINLTADQKAKLKAMR